MIHLKQSFYLAIWKDLNKEERKEQRNKIKLLKLGGLSGACLCTFGAQAVRTQNDIADDIPNISPPISPSDIPNIYWGYIQGIPIPQCIHRYPLGIRQVFPRYFSGIPQVSPWYSPHIIIS